MASASLMRIILPLSLLVLLVAIAEARHSVQEEVINRLSSKQDLILHCYKRKGRDLGARVLHYGQSFKFSFKPSFFGTTKYYCSVKWAGSNLKWFDLYLKKRDAKQCRNCSWIIRETATCRFNYDSKSYSDCFPMRNH